MHIKLNPRLHALLGILHASIFAQKYTIYIILGVSIAIGIYLKSINFTLFLIINLINIFILPLLLHELFHMLIIIFFYIDTLVMIQFKSMHIDIVYEKVSDSQIFLISISGVFVNLLAAIYFLSISRLEINNISSIFLIFSSLTNLIFFLGSIIPTSNDGKHIFNFLGKYYGC